MFKKSTDQRGDLCPLLKKPCIQNKCMWWIQVRGSHPQTGEEVDHYGCAVAWMPVLQIEQSKETRQAAAAVESTRNNIVRLSQEARNTTRKQELDVTPPKLVIEDKTKGK